MIGHGGGMSGIASTADVAAICRRFGVVWIAREAGVARVASSMDNDRLRERLAFALGGPVEVEVWPENRIVAELAGVAEAPRTSVPDRPGENATLAAWLDQILADITREDPSDVHFECEADSLVVRARVAGQLRMVGRFEAALREPVVARLKLLSGLKGAERRLPQDGRLRLAVAGSPEFRVATLPTVHGENVVLRVLRPRQRAWPLEELGMSAAQREAVRATLQRPSGLVVVAGATGAGKTTTAYALLREVAARSRKLVTIEDPVEIVSEDSLQWAIDGTTRFAEALRCLLRHDPDVILVGEIRDVETARAAVQAALTGHLVITTVHARGSVGVIARLLNLGVAPFALAATLRLVVSQHLAEREGRRTGVFTLADSFTSSDFPR